MKKKSLASLAPSSILRKLTQCRAAESLVEVIIALFVLALGSGIAATLVVTALQSNSFSRDNLVALNLAVEGIEAMRSIRDNNWLKYSFDRENCWNLRPDQPCADPYDGTIGDGFYTVYLDNNYVWQLRNFGSDPAANALDLKDAGQPKNLPYRIEILKDLNTGLKFYTPKYAVDDANSFPAVFDPHPDTTDPANDRFFRMITVSQSTSTSMQVDAIVQWFSQGAVRSVKLTSQLTNYQKTK